MIKVKMFKRMLTILLILSLMYANANMAIFGIVSYALNNVQEIEETEKEEVKPINVEISEFSKNAMLEQETEYSEKITLNISRETSLKEIVVSDINSKIYNQILGENEEIQEIDTFYTNTKINKTELMKKIGQNGSLEIEYFELQIENEVVVEAEKEQTTQAIVYQDNQQIITLPDEEKQSNTTQGVIELPNEEENNVIQLPSEEENDVIQLPDEEVASKGIINAEKGLVKINKDTETDEEGYITIAYPENTNLVNLKIVTEKNQVQDLEIVNNKKIEKLQSLNEIKLETSKKIQVQNEEEIIETVETPIYYTKTVAELGVDKTEISTSVDNKVNFTITLATEKAIYDLYKNPQFIIELPSELETINIHNIVILNNQYFEIDTIEQGLLENGNKAILIKMKGEQTAHTQSTIENIQILLETTLKTNQLIPTLNRTINLYYHNENAKTYDGIGIQLDGISSSELNLVSNSEIIVETKAIVGENVTASLREDYKEITIEPETYQSVQIIGTAINNTGADIQNAVILGTATNVGQISGIDKVYYTENENATKDLNNAENMWSAEYTPNAKKYLIVIDNFAQGQTVTFGYNMNLSTNIENDIIHEVSFDVYNNENVKTSKITINQEAKHFDIFENDTIRTNIQIDNPEKVEIGKLANAKVNITNKTAQNIEGISLDISVPDTIKDVYAKAYINGEMIDAEIVKEDNTFYVRNLQIDSGTTVTIEVNAGISQYIQPTEKIKAIIKYEQLETEISNKIYVQEPSQIETTITSNKTGETLDGNESIQYKVVLRNTGESTAETEIKLPELNGINVQKVESVNLSTGEKKSMTGVSLNGVIQSISINSGEVVEVYIDATAKELKKNTVQTMYVNVAGNGCYDATTSQLGNTINKKKEQVENTVDKTTDATENTIKGIAWIDRNQNGQKDESELLLKGVQAVLINTENSEEVKKQTTNNNGEYSFENIENGNYIVQFKYNTRTLSVTDYKAEEVSEDLDSDIINTTQKNETIAKTEMITVSQGKTENVNAGFIVNKTFDMSINKGITKVTVNNEQGTKNYDFGNTNMAKIEIDGEYLKGSLILVEYEIAVTNIGEVAGYAKVISDKIPEGMKFSSELNNNWYEESDGTLYSEALADKELKPGETATIKLVLTKEMTDDKIVSPVNTVKIEETFNKYLITDKKNDNNSAEATIIISLTTGGEQSYLWLSLIIVTIIGTGIFGVQRLTKKSTNNLTNKERRK